MHPIQILIVLSFGLSIFDSNYARADEAAQFMKEACAKYSWGCFERAQFLDAINPVSVAYEPDACRKPKLSGGLPPIVVPPVIAAFDFSTRALVLRQLIIKSRDNASKDSTTDNEKLADYELACTARIPGGCSRSGDLEMRLRHDVPKTKQIYSGACLSGDAEMCFRAAFFYATDLETRNFLWAGCRLGNLTACKWGRFAEPPNIFQFAHYKFRSLSSESLSVNSHHPKKYSR